MKTIRGLASELARREGKKSQVAIGNIRELLGHLSDIVYEWGRDLETSSEAPNNILWMNGEKRAKKAKKK